MKFHPIMLAMSTVLLPLAGCGGGDSDTTPTVATSTYSVKAIDGYLNGALVWLDLNRNFELDNNEPSTYSKQGGLADLDVSGVSNYKEFPVVVKAIANQTIDEDLGANGALVTSNYLMSAPAGNSVITPLSSLVHIKIKQGDSEEEAVAAVANQLGMAKAQILTDYVQTGDDKALAKASALVELGVLPETGPQFNKVADVNDTASTDFEMKLEAHKPVLQQLEKGQRLVTDQSGEAKVVSISNKDRDQDGVDDALDAFPDDETEWRDCDKDGIGDVADLDDDSDGIDDTQDAFPFNKNESADFDKDGIGDNADTDDDNDGYLDKDDAFDNDPTEWANFDNDELGDNADPDDDNDGYLDVDDAFDNDPKEWTDTDTDGIGNNTDPDDDGDGFDDVDDTKPLVKLDHPDNYQACLDSLEDADYVRQTGDTAHYQSQRSVAWVNNFELTHYLESFEHQGDNYSWMTSIAHLTELPSYLTTVQGTLTREKFSMYNPIGELLSNEMGYVWGTDYLGQEGVNSAGSFAGWGNLRAALPTVYTNSQLLLNEAEKYVAYNVKVADAYNAAQGSSFSDLAQTEVVATRTYQGKDIVRVPAGLFEACILEQTAKLKNADGSYGTEGEADVNKTWFINRGFVKQEQKAPSWAPVYNRQATKLPPLIEDVQAIVAEKQKIEAIFSKLTELYVGQVPSEEAIQGYLADSFSLDDMQKERIIKGLTETQSAGLRFENIKFVEYNHNAGIAVVDLDFVVTGELTTQVLRWKLEKKLTGEWVILGDQELAMIYFDIQCSQQTTHGLNSPAAIDTTSGCGVTTQVTDESNINNLAAGVDSIRSARISVINTAGEVLSDSQFLMGESEGFTPGELKVYNEQYGQPNANDYFAFDLPFLHAGYTFTSANMQPTNRIQYELFDEGLVVVDSVMEVAPTAKPVQLAYRDIPARVKLISEMEFAVLSPEMYEALAAYQGGSLDISWSASDKVVPYEMYINISQPCIGDTCPESVEVEFWNTIEFSDAEVNINANLSHFIQGQPFYKYVAIYLRDADGLMTLTSHNFETTKQ